MFYSYGDATTTVDAVRANIRALVDRPEFSGRLERFLVTHHWRYFPHVGAEAMQAGFFDALEGRQGRRRTYYVGELLSFPLVELVVRHAHGLVDARF